MNALFEQWWLKNRLDFGVANRDYAERVWRAAYEIGWRERDRYAPQQNEFAEAAQ